MSMAALPTGMPMFERISGSLRFASPTVIVPPSLIAGAFLSRTPQFTATKRANIGPFGVHATLPEAPTVKPAGPKSTSTGPVASPSTSEPVTLNVTAVPQGADVGGVPAQTAGVSGIVAVA